MDIYRKHYNKKTDYGISSTRKRKIMELLGDVAGKKVLDVGCGSGILGNEIKKKGAREVVGADISAGAIKEASKVLGKAVVADLQTERLDYADGYFDVIVIAEVLEHVLYPENVVKEAKRLLKDDGFIIISTPNFLIFSNRIRMLFGQFEYTEDGFLDRGHVHFFTLPSLKKFLNINGLKIVKENHTIHDRFPEWFGKLFSSLFSFQLIIKIKAQ
jgi:2-polyprenyl-3-methyl-5-hydroxy-6-metoxy-1,4-benzoquinol methylase